MELFDEIVKVVRENNLNVYSLCEVYNGKVRCEDLQKTTEPHACYSVAKAFTVTAIGMLVDRGLLRVTDKIVDIFADEMPEKYDENWNLVTVEMVMKHQAGLPWGYLDQDNDNIQEKYGTGDFLRLIFETPMAYVPGQDHEYSDAAYYLLSRVVTKVSGEKMDDMMVRELFAPMKFQQVAWGKCPMGYVNGATALFITTRDMAKLGELYINKGKWNGKQIISEDWVNTVIEKRYEFWPIAAGCHKGGMHGQELYFSMKNKRVIAYHSCDGGELFDEITRTIERLDT